MKTILVLEKNESILIVLTKFFESKNYKVRSTSHIETILDWIQSDIGDLVFIELDSNKSYQINYFNQLMKKSEVLPIVLSTNIGLSDLEQISNIIKNCYIISKPFDLLELEKVIFNAFKFKKTTLSINILDKFPLVGISYSVKAVLMEIHKISSKKLNILLLGERGVGKKSISKIIHSLSYNNKNYKIFDAAKITATEIDNFFNLSNLDLKPEKFTIVINEILDLPYEMQDYFIKALQKHDNILDEKKELDINYRVIATSSKDILNYIKLGYFRQDLYYQLNMVAINIPNLFERSEDIPVLIDCIISKLSKKNKRKIYLSSLDMDLISSYNWPGNITQLKSYIYRCFELYDESTDIFKKEIQNEKNSSYEESYNKWEENLSAIIRKHFNHLFNMKGKTLPRPGIYYRMLKEFEIPLILQVLKATDYNQLYSAEILGLNRNTLRKKMKDLQIKINKESTTKILK